MIKKSKNTDEVVGRADDADSAEDFIINEKALDKEWTRQPKLVFYYMFECNKHRHIVDSLKLELESLRAELYKSIRNNADMKVTEKTIESEIMTNEKVIELNKSIIDAKTKQNEYECYINALDHKKRALEKLVDLHCTEYYSTPKENKNRTHIKGVK